MLIFIFIATLSANLSSDGFFNSLSDLVVYRNKDTLLSQAAAHRASMNRNPPASKNTSSEKALVEESTPVVASASVSTDGASNAVGEILSSSSAPSAPKKPHAIVVSMSASTIPIDVSSWHLVCIPIPIYRFVVRVFYLTFRCMLCGFQIAPDNDPRKKKLRNNQKRSKNKKRQKDGKPVTGGGKF